MYTRARILKNLKAKVLTVLGCFAMLLGLGAGIASITAQQENEVVETKADSVPVRVYVDINNCQWKSWGATLSNIKAHFFKGGTGYTTWPGTSVTTCTINGTEYGYATVPSGATQVIFNAWDGGSNQNKTGDLTIPTDGKLLFKITSYNTSSVQTGNWESLDYIQTSAVSPSTSTARVFFYNTETYWKDKTVAIRAWGRSAGTVNNHPVSGTIYLGGFQWFLDGSTWYGCADVPQDIDGFQIVETSGSGTSATAVDYSNGFSLAEGAIHVLYGDTYNKSNKDLTAGGAHDDTANATLMAKVLEAINTCNSNSYAGYGAYSTLNTLFYSHATNDAKESTCRTLNNSTVFKVSAHFEGMSSRASGGSTAGVIPGPSSDQSPLTLTLWIVLGAGIAGMGAIGAAYFVSKKKKRPQA